MVASIPHSECNLGAEVMFLLEFEIAENSMALPLARHHDAFGGQKSLRE